MDKHEELKEMLPYIDIVESSERNKGIIRMYADGLSAKPISNHFGISHERVYYIVRRFKRNVRIYIHDHKN